MSGSINETRMPTPNAAAIDTMHGFFSGTIASGNLKTSTQTVPERTIMPMDSTVPVTMEATAPHVLNFFQTIDMSSDGKFALAAMEKARPTMKATFWPL